jgi:hypothetical protein
VFENHREKDAIYPLTTIEIAEAQQKDRESIVYYTQNAETPKEDVRFQLIEDTKLLCKNDKLIIPASLQHRAVSWYHHYLLHPGHLCLELMLRSMMYLKGMRNTVWNGACQCRSKRDAINLILRLCCRTFFTYKDPD